MDAQVVGDVHQRANRKVRASLQPLEIGNRHFKVLGKLRLRFAEVATKLGEATTENLGYLLRCRRSHAREGVLPPVD